MPDFNFVEGFDAAPTSQFHRVAAAVALDQRSDTEYNLQSKPRVRKRRGTYMGHHLETDHDCFQTASEKTNIENAARAEVIDSHDVPTDECYTTQSL